MFKRLMKRIFGSDQIAERRAMGYGMGMTFEELLAQTNDYNLANGTFCLIDQPYHGCFDASQYTSIERPIMLTWHASGIIGNGGFEYLFEGPWQGDPDYSLTLAAHRDVGLMDRYEAFVRALSAFPDGRAPLDDSEKHAIYMTVPEDTRNETNHLFWGKHDRNPKEVKVAEYIRKNVAGLQHLHGRIS